ncbi:hypothetical protein Aple_090230 [Acrocarpospora pleiomorpha]|uniref:non-specific serine/threonine protein kinase n=1 Tax=Acrocarpospora pleiomorpha TaxID=90975 RepID=A0A5M3XYB7_9ACTN|nr:hypothetical protein [Acrocarpospora pleiomorpha]GES26124.1 hypothetical protein Aple_090230 [Acrocarpospora pleiomorpha]
MTGGFTRLDSDIHPGKCAYYPQAYSDGRFRVRGLISGQGQGYVLRVDDMWGGNAAVLKGMWWNQQTLAEPARAETELNENVAELYQGLRAATQSTQLSQQAPAIVEVLLEPSPSLLAVGVANPPDELFIVQQFIGHGEIAAPTLADHLRQRAAEKRPFTEAELLDLADQLCNALAALHATRRQDRANRTTYWIHADVKPQNILVLGPPWRYVLIDYEGAVEKGSIVRLTTEGYAPPESPRPLEREQADQRFDLYMLGATLAEAAGLRRLSPGTRSDLYGTDKNAHLEAKKQLSELGYGPILTSIVATCLSSPDFRLAEVGAVQHELSRVRQNSALRRALMGT